MCELCESEWFNDICDNCGCCDDCTDFLCDNDDGKNLCDNCRELD